MCSFSSKKLTSLSLQIASPFLAKAGNPFFRFHLQTCLHLRFYVVPHNKNDLVTKKLIDHKYNLLLINLLLINLFLWNIPAGTRRPGDVPWTCSKLIINELACSPTRSENVYFANNKQASIAVSTAVFCFTHAEHHLIKLKLYNNWSAQALNSVLYEIQRNQSNLLTFKN